MVVVAVVVVIVKYSDLSYEIEHQLQSRMLYILQSRMLQSRITITINFIVLSSIVFFRYISVRLLMKAANSEVDDEVSCVDLNQKFRLSCPITLMRIGIPARGRHCRHFQCFDLESFVQVTKGAKAFNNRWKCPECPNILRTGVLMIDKYVSEILRTVR